jgi:hypothetical protein
MEDDIVRAARDGESVREPDDGHVQTVVRAGDASVAAPFTSRDGTVMSGAGSRVALLT